MIDVKVGDIIIPKKHKKISSHFLSGWERSFTKIIVIAVNHDYINYKYERKNHKFRDFFSIISTINFNSQATVCPINRKKLDFNERLQKL